MRKILVLFIVFSFLSSLISQSEIDSLKGMEKKFMLTNKDSFFIISDKIISKCKKEKLDSFLVDTYFKRAMMYQIAKDFEQALSYYDSAEIYSKSFNKDNLRARFGKSEMMLKLRINDNKLGNLFEKNIQDAIKFNDSLLITGAYTRYANYYMSKSQYVDAIKMLIKSIEYKSKLQPLARILDLAKLAKLFLVIDDTEKAEFYVDEAHTIAYKNKYKIDDRIVALLRGKIAVRKQEYDKADSLFNIALKSYTKANAKKDIFATYVLLSNLKLHQRNNSKAQRYMDFADKYLSKNIELNSKALYFLTKARIDIVKGNYNSASNNLDLLESTIANKQILLYKIDLIRTRAALEKKRQNYKKSLFLTEEYHKLQDSLFKFKTSQHIFDLEAKYQAKEKQKQIELLAANNKLYKLKLKQGKLEKVIILAGSSIGLLFLLFLGITYYKVREKNKIIEKALKQKDILLKEIHHRVKNNLQLISSLLNLQSRYIKDEKAKQVSLEGKNRVRAMSLIHQFLYQKEDLINLSLDEYFRKLVKELFEAYQIPEDKIKVDFEIEKMQLDVDRVIPLGLIFNELLTNILKYAFPGERHGNIKIELKKESKKLILEIKDDGVGFDGENDFSDDKTFGFTLIDALLKKWNGEFKISSENGTKATVSIPDIDFK